MDYQVLARKWRPKTFSDVIGQKHILTALINSLSLKKIHHAWLFSGTHGIGKTSIARLLAKSLNCKVDITATPCGVCKNCYEIDQGCFIDFIEVDAASRTKVEDICDLLNNTHYAPVYGRFKVYLIDEVHMLSRHSFNALLKTLEEPPMHVKFLLATTDPQKLPITILSRCLQFHLKVLKVEQIYYQLEFILTKEQINYNSQALWLLAKAAEGSLRDALNLSEQAIADGNGKLTMKAVNNILGLLDNKQALLIIEAIIEANGKRIINLINDAASRGVEWNMFLIEIQSLLHRIAIAQLLPSTSLIPATNANILEKRIRELASTILPTDVQHYYQMILVGRRELSFAPDHRMGVEMILLRTLTFRPKKLLL